MAYDRHTGSYGPEDNENINLLYFEYNLPNILYDFKSYPFYTEEVNPNEFAMVKLNGTAGSTYSIQDKLDMEQIFPPSVLKYSKNLLKKNYDKIEGMINNFDQFLKSSFLNFAWESYNSISEKTREAAYILSEKTQILVVIGYSFPFFNREIDRKMINGMQGLKKVYFQYPSAHDQISIFNSIRDDIGRDKLIPVESTNQFFLPHEL